MISNESGRGNFGSNYTCSDLKILGNHQLRQRSHHLVDLQRIKKLVDCLFVFYLPSKYLGEKEKEQNKALNINRLGYTHTKIDESCEFSHGIATLESRRHVS